MEREVFSYRFAYRYEKFRPFRLERNGINNNASKAGRILGPNTVALANALAISQHHDAVCGTEREHVAADYAKRLSMGYAEVQLSLICNHNL